MRERAVSLEHTGLVPRPIRDKLRRSVFGVLGPAGAGARILNASDRRVWIVLLHQGDALRRRGYISHYPLFAITVAL